MTQENIEVQLTRKQREREARRIEIINAAIQVFAEKGYDNATLEEIAQRAEFAKGTLYHYFNSKEELFLTLLFEGMDQFNKLAVQAAQLTHLSSVERLKSFAYSLVEFYRDRELFVKITINEFVRIINLPREHYKEIIDRRNAMVSIIGGIIEEGIKRGELTELSSHLAADIFMNLFRSIAFTNICNGKEIFSEDDIELVLRIFFDGVKK